MSTSKYCVIAITSFVGVYYWLWIQAERLDNAKEFYFSKKTFCIQCVVLDVVLILKRSVSSYKFLRQPHLWKSAKLSIRKHFNCQPDTKIGLVSLMDFHCGAFKCISSYWINFKRQLSKKYNIYLT